MADVLRGRLAEPEMRPVDEHVDRRDGERVAADDCGVVAEPAHDPGALAELQRPGDRLDQPELTHGARRAGPPERARES